MQRECQIFSGAEPLYSVADFMNSVTCALVCISDVHCPGYAVIIGLEEFYFKESTILHLSADFELLSDVLKASELLQLFYHVLIDADLSN